MLSLEDLKNDPALVAQIDWHITPQEAFETYQLKSPGNWRGGNLPPVIYFYISTWKGQEPRLYLVERSLKHSREIAEIEAPAHLLRAPVEAQDKAMVPKGQAAIDETLREWLQDRLSA
jgi:hypothetical protein